MVELVRRSFLTGLGALLVTAPAIVRATSIMPVRALKPEWPINYLGYPLTFDGGFPSDIHALLEQRIINAESVFHRHVRRSLDELIYKTGTSAAGDLNELFA